MVPAHGYADHNVMAERGDCMKASDFYSSLCTKDTRSPYFESIYGRDGEDWPGYEIIPRQNCACDNCFYGRDRLALVIIELLERE